MALDHEPHIRHARKALADYDQVQHLWSIDHSEHWERALSTAEYVAMNALRVLLYEPADGWQPPEEG